MKVSVTYVGFAAFIRPLTPLAAGASFAALDVAVGTALRSRVRGVFLDLAEVTLLDCTGIGALIRLAQAVRSSVRAFGIVNIDPRQCKLLDMAGLTSRLAVYESVDRAMASLPAAVAALGRSVSGQVVRFTPLDHRTGAVLESTWALR